MKTNALRQIVGEALEKTAAAAPLAHYDEAVHEIRKTIKQARALLRLSGETNRTEAAALGVIGRRLSPYRDAEAIVKTFDSVLARYSGQLPPQKASAIRRGLLARKTEMDQAPAGQNLIPPAVRSLRLIARNIAASQEPGAPLAGALKETVRRAEKAFRKARKHPSPETLHQWRKRAKEQWHQMSVLNPKEATSKQLDRLQKVVGLLGEDHNLAVLREIVLTGPGSYGSRPNVESFLTFAMDYELSLREEALALGAKIYARISK